MYSLNFYMIWLCARSRHPAKPKLYSYLFVYSLPFPQKWLFQINVFLTSEYRLLSLIIQKPVCWLKYIPYLFKCGINSFKCWLFFIVHGTATAVKNIRPTVIRSFTHTHIHTVIRSVIPFTGIDIQLVWNTA